MQIEASSAGSLYFSLCCLPDTHERPATTMVVAPQTNVTLSITHREHLCHSLAASDDCAQPIIDKVVGAPCVLHASWDCTHIASKSHCCDCDWCINCCFHYPIPPLGCVVLSIKNTDYK